MNKLVFTILIFVGFFGAVSSTSAQTQAELNGRYLLEHFLENGQTDRIVFELKKNRVATYSKTNAAMEEFQERKGFWIWNKSQKLLVVTMPSAENYPSKVIVSFKLDGKNLKVVKISPVTAGKIGDVFKKT